MVKIEAITLEKAYEEAATQLQCSVTELQTEVVQTPTKGFLGLFKKSAIIVAVVKMKETPQLKEEVKQEEVSKAQESESEKNTQTQKESKKSKKTVEPTMLNETIMPTSFVSDQDEEDEDLLNGLDYTADYDDAYDEQENTHIGINGVAKEVKQAVNELFAKICFDIDEIAVSVYDEQTLLVEFTGEDAALLIGKEGYRYKALSYMLFNWINAKYNVQLRLEIAEFLKNQEEGVGKYLENIYENTNGYLERVDSDKYYILLNYLYLSYYISYGKSQEAIKYGEKIVEVIETKNIDLKISMKYKIYENLSMAYLFEKMYHEAIESAKKALKIQKTLLTLSAFGVLSVLAEAYYALKDYDESLVFATEANSYTNNSIGKLSYLYEILSKIYASKGDREQASEYLIKLRELKDTLAKEKIG